MKVVAAPPKSLLMRVLKVFWSSQAPVLLMVAPPPVRMRPASLKPELVQVVVPAVLRVRPPRRSLTFVPLSASVPLVVVLPAPVMVPLLQVLAPLMVSAPAPPMVPPLRSRLAASKVRPTLKLPPLTTNWPPKLLTPLVLTVPPLTSMRPVPVPDSTALRLWVPPPKFSVLPVATSKLPLLVPPPLSASVALLMVTTPVPTPLLVLLNPIWISVLPAPDLV